MSRAVSFKIIGITDVTVRNILQRSSCEALGLYMTYFEIAKWQETYRVKATTGFIAKRTGWGRDKVIKYKKQLTGIGVIKDFIDKGEDGLVKGHYIEIKHLVDDIHTPEPPEGGEVQRVDDSDTSAINNSISAINKIEVLDQFEIIWTLYNFKSGKKKALQKFETIIKASKEPTVLIEKIEKSIPEYLAHLSAETWKQQKGLQVWLNGECWNDEYEIKKTGKQSNIIHTQSDKYNNLKLFTAESVEK